MDKPTTLAPVDFEVIVQRRLAELRDRNSVFNATVESDPAYAVIEDAAVAEMLIRQRLNEVAASQFVRFATAGDLEARAADYGVARLPGEEIERFRTRTLDRIASIGTVGSAPWFRYFAMTAEPALVDVNVDSPAGGVVRLSLVTAEGAATEEQIATVSNAFVSDSSYMLGQTIEIVSAVEMEIDVVAEVRLLPDAPPYTAANLETRLRAAWQSMRSLGRDLEPTTIIAALADVHTKSVYVQEPASAVVVLPRELVKLRDVTITLGARGR
jgi:phage-related baseplate assembly protein